MSEPTVRVPLRLALRAARHLHHLGKALAGTTGEKACGDMSAELQKHIADQSSMEDLRVAVVALELQEHA